MQSYLHYENLNILFVVITIILKFKTMTNFYIKIFHFMIQANYYVHFESIPKRQVIGKVSYTFSPL